MTTAAPRAAGVELRGVSKRFGAVEVLRDIDLRIEGGEFVVFVGPSGCGKSTLLRLIAGLDDVTDGEIAISGRDVTFADPSERGIAMVFQSYALYPHMSVAENMGFGLRMAHRPAREVAARVGAAAEALRLTALLDRRPSQLSGGQRQRVAIGRAIVRDPDVFLFDEPLSNLDAELRVEMRLEIGRLHGRLANTMVYVTHDQTEAMTLADRIVVLRAGRIEQVGTPAELYADPANTFVAGFIGSPKMNFLPARLTPAGIEVGGGMLPSPVVAMPPAPEVELGIRPEHLVPAGPDAAGLAMTVTYAEFLGGTSYLYGQLATGEPLVMEAPRGQTVPVGQALRVTAAPDDLRLFDRHGGRLR